MSVFPLSSCFKKKENGHQVQCLICNCWLPSCSESFLSSHVSGRKHKQEVEKKKTKEHSLKCSIYVKGFDPQLVDLEDELRSYFESFGVTVKDVYVDKNTASYCIVELSNEDSVEIVVNTKKSLFHGNKLIVRRREERKQNNDSCTSSQISEHVVFDAVMLKEVTSIVASEGKCSIQMGEMVEKFELNEDEMELRKLICRLVQNVLEEVYSNCEVMLFGSSANGLGLKHCDVDMTVVPSDGSTSTHDEKNIMENIRNLLQRFAPGCKSVQLIESLKTCTIIKFYHTDSKLNVDLSWNNRLAIENTRLLYAYIHRDPRIKPLVVTVRIWAKLKALSGKLPTQLTSYAWTIMVVHYLQQIKPPVLPCFQDTISEKILMIGPWNCSFDEEMTSFHMLNTEDTGVLLLNFFAYYSEFDTAKKCVSIHTSKLLSREEAKEMSEGKGSCLLNTDASFVVQDPFKRSHNVSQNLSDSGLQLLCNKMKKAHRDLTLCLSLKTLFDEDVLPKKHRNKQKHKRNRSSVYSVTLPNCSHMSSSTSAVCCANVATNLLVDDLQMKRVQTHRNESNAQISEVVNTQTCIGHKRKFECSTGVGEAKKTKYDDIATPQTFVLIASKDTWTSRRKERRMKLHPHQCDIESKCHDSVETAQQLEKVALDKGITSTVNPVQSNTADKNTKDIFDVNEPITNDATEEYLFKFKVLIQQATCDNEVCKLTIEPLDLQNNIMQFQTFFAYFKKEVIANFK